MTFRFARHTNKLKEIIKFYKELLKFEILGQFEDHEGYNGVFIGLKNADWHLEFTETKEPVNHTFDEDDILVFYPQNEIEYNTILSQINKSNIKRITSKNPYWRSNGIMFLDPDGYRIVISPLKFLKRE